MTSIVFCGNVANTHFAVVAALCNTGHDAHLLVGRDDPLSWRPETDDPNLAGRYPSWIHEARWYNARDAVVPWRAPIVHKLREFDVVIASGSTPAFAQFAGRPWCFFATGGDITVRPFPWTFRHRRGLPPAQLGHGVLSAWPLIGCWWVDVGGHEILPGGGRECACWWPVELPGGGQLICPR